MRCLPKSGLLLVAAAWLALLGAGEAPPHLGYRVGWPEVARATAAVAAELSGEERERLTVLATGFPIAGALDHFGPALGLPRPVATHNSYWDWGPGRHDGSVTLVVTEPGHAVLADFREVSPGLQRGTSPTRSGTG